MAEEGRYHLRRMRPAIVALMTSSPVCTPPVIAIEASMRPASAAVPRDEAALRRIRERQRPNHFELVDIDIDAMKPGE